MPETPTVAEKLILVTWAEEWEALRRREQDSGHFVGAYSAPSVHAPLPTERTAERCGISRERVLSVIYRWRPASDDSPYFAERLLAEKETKRARPKLKLVG